MFSQWFPAPFVLRLGTLPCMTDIVDVLLNMASCGSFSVSNAVFLLSSDELDVLESKGWVDAHGCEFYSLTARAASCLISTVTYAHGVRLPNYSSCSDPAKMTVLELIQALTASGWEEEVCKAPKSKPPFTKNSSKVWFSPPDKPPFRSYLQALVQSKTVLKNAKQIFHGQLDSQPIQISNFSPCCVRAV